MTSREFCYWLQGFLEISNKDPRYTGSLNREQVNMIGKHLSLVFIHEIDNSYGNKEHTDKLNDAHNGPPAYMLKPPHSYKDLYAQHDEIDDKINKQSLRPRC